MLNFHDLLNDYPKRLQGFKDNILKEYLQYQILNYIFSSKYARQLVFLGGTAIRIVHNGIRFSEDLDFDNLGLAEKDLDDVAGFIEQQLSLDGYEVDIKAAHKGAFHCYIKFPGILFTHGLSGHKQSRILIQIDAEPQNYPYTNDKYLLDQFGIFRYIQTVPVSLLLSQKIFACLNRKRAQGRDFFDVVFLMSKTQPDYEYLKNKIGLGDKISMIQTLKKKVRGLNMKDLANEVEPFLFEAFQKERVLKFEEWLDKI